MFSEAERSKCVFKCAHNAVFYSPVTTQSLHEVEDNSRNCLRKHGSGNGQILWD